MQSSLKRRRINRVIDIVPESQAYDEDEESDLEAVLNDELEHGDFEVSDDESDSGSESDSEDDDLFEENEELKKQLRILTNYTESLEQKIKELEANK